MPYLTKGEGSQGHCVSSQLDLNLAPSLLGLHCPVSARILLSHFVKNPSTPDIWSPVFYQIPHPPPWMPGPSGLPSGRILLSWFNKNPPPVSSSLVIHWPPHSGLVCKPQHPLFCEKLVSYAKVTPAKTASCSPWPQPLHIWACLTIQSSGFYCPCLFACLFLLQPVRFWPLSSDDKIQTVSRNISPLEPWAHLTCTTFCKHLWLSHDTVTSSFDQKIKTNVTLGSTLSLPSVTSIMESVFCQFKANALHAF